MTPPRPEQSTDAPTSIEEWLDTHGCVGAERQRVVLEHLIEESFVLAIPSVATAYIEKMAQEAESR